jgi:hypothetical protein
MKRFFFSLAIAFLIGKKNAILFWKAYPIALDQTVKAVDSLYYGNVKHNICYERTRTLLFNEGVDKQNLKGAVIHFAVALAYLNQPK